MRPARALRTLHRGCWPLHRIRLKVKAMRYLLECCLSKRAAAGNPELKRLRQIQTCLGDMHDDENLLNFLRAERGHLDVARGIRAKLKARKGQRVHAFKRCRKGLVRRKSRSRRSKVRRWRTWKDSATAGQTGRNSRRDRALLA
jgi:CHAD domain-containing protein